MEVLAPRRRAPKGVGVPPSISVKVWGVLYALSVWFGAKYWPLLIFEHFKTKFERW